MLFSLFFPLYEIHYGRVSSRLCPLEWEIRADVAVKFFMSSHLYASAREYARDPRAQGC